MTMTELGKIIHRVRDHYGEIVVRDKGSERILSFGRNTRQSAMLPDTPGALPLLYTQAMMTALLFQAQPKKALFLGLGAGTMPCFLLRHCPDCQVDCVELRKEVVRVAHTYFDLPENDPRLRVHLDDALHFLESRTTGDYDLIFSDLFSESGPANCVQEKNFLADCRNNLSRNGILICNTWTVTTPNFSSLANATNDFFDKQTLTLELAARYNAVVFAFQDPHMLTGLMKRRACAEQLRIKTAINFPSFLKQLIEQNVPLMKRVFSRV